MSDLHFLTELVQRQGFAMLDGALATELERRGADLNDVLWSAKILLESPEWIQNVHFDYLLAGADIILTASYQATFEGFRHKDIPHQQAAALMEQSVELAIEARRLFWSNKKNRKGRQFPLIAASVGPYGAMLADGSEYTGNYSLSLKELMEFHRPRIAILADSGADLLAFETIPSYLEAEAILRLLPEWPQLRAWLSFSCCDGLRVSHGERLSDCVEMVDRSPQVLAVGINCTEPSLLESLLRSIAPITPKLLIAYPNSGEQWDALNHCWIPGTSAFDLPEMALQWYQAGARIIGGCCRTGPEDVRGMRQALEVV